MYTHYWYSKTHLDPDIFNRFAADVKKVLKEIGVPLARECDDPDTDPVINEQEVRFNGIGDDGHETFLFTRDTCKQDYTDGDKAFTFCGTARKPYDIAVTACLVLARYHFGNSVRVSSDGCSADWEQAIELVNKTFGYPMQAVDERSDGESLIQEVKHKDPVASDKEIVSVFGK